MPGIGMLGRTQECLVEFSPRVNPLEGGRIALTGGSVRGKKTQHFIPVRERRRPRLPVAPSFLTSAFEDTGR